MTLHFERNAAENRGVKIVKVKSHHQFTLPTGLVFRTFADNYFPCTDSNKEAKEWFLKNVRGAFLL